MIGRVLLATAAMVAVAAAPVRPHHPQPAHRQAPRDWSKVVTLSPDGSYVMGNPQAPVKIVEFGSYTCPHCAHFSGEVVPQLVAKYVATGKASYDFRNAVRDRYDAVAAVLARCTGARGFFPATAAVYAAQQDWVQQAIGYEQAHEDEIDKLTGADKGVAIARAAGLDTLFTARGLTADKQRACLADPQQLGAIVAMSKDATETRAIPGTPAVYLNGTLVDGALDWTKLDAAIAAALK